MKRFSKSVVALVAALGLLALLANPSAASSGTITGGTLTVNLTPTLVVTLGGTGTCAPIAITALDSSTGTTGSTPVNGTVTVAITQNAFTYSGANYVSAGTFTGTYSSTHTTASDYSFTSHMTMANGTIKAASTTDPCASTGTTRCPAIGVTSFTISGTANLTAVHPGPVGTAHLGGSGHISGFCTAPFSALNSKTVSLSSVTVVLT